MRVTTLVLASLMLAAAQALQGLLPYWRWTSNFYEGDYVKVTGKIRTYNGWKTNIQNDQSTFEAGLLVQSSNRFSIEIELFEGYKYIYVVHLDPIRIQPLTFRAEYYFANPLTLDLFMFTKVEAGKISSWVWQLNKDYDVSLLDPLTDDDDNTSIENTYTHYYNEPPYYTKYESKVDGKQTALLNWSPLASEAIEKVYFAWSVFE